MSDLLTKDCPRCNGAGKIELDLGPHDNAPKPEILKCPQCEGAGTINRMATYPANGYCITCGAHDSEPCGNPDLAEGCG